MSELANELFADAWDGWADSPPGERAALGLDDLAAMDELDRLPSSAPAPAPPGHIAARVQAAVARHRRAHAHFIAGVQRITPHLRRRGRHIVFALPARSPTHAAQQLGLHPAVVSGLLQSLRRTNARASSVPAPGRSVPTPAPFESSVDSADAWASGQAFGLCCGITCTPGRGGCGGGGGGGGPAPRSGRTCVGVTDARACWWGFRLRIDSCKTAQLVALLKTGTPAAAAVCNLVGLAEPDGQGDIGERDVLDRRSMAADQGGQGSARAHAIDPHEIGCPRTEPRPGPHDQPVDLAPESRSTRAAR